ncbi:MULTISPECIES: PP0621 family protein [unclassified Campylobacter]|uniref:PP0621 family protein n=1 Tax=unclassified Campylobacter TaxID=2593542 RepID=UPI003D328D4B
MLGKILTLIIVGVIIYVVFFKILRKKDETNKEIENFVECEKCGTFVATKDAVLSGGKFICRECIKG